MLAKQSSKTRAKQNISWRFHTLIFAFSFVVLGMRRPDALFNPQFWAEDGSVWYADTYNLGAINTLFLPYAGYLGTFQRLIGAFTQLFPLIWGPLIFNLVAIFIQILPVTLVTSSRFSILIPSLYVRLLIALIYLFLPNSAEIHANLTNSQWNLALLAYMVMLAKPSVYLVWRLFDVGIILLSALSGPYAIFLTPIAALLILLRRNEQWQIFLLFGLLTGALTQAITIRSQTAPINVHTPSLGTELNLLSKIIGGQLFLGSLIGKSGYAWIEPHVNWLIFAVFAIAGIAAFIYALVKAPLELKLFIIYAASILGSTLLSPLVRGDTIQSFWEAMQSPGLGGRYYFIPRLAFIVTIIWIISKQESNHSKIIAKTVLATILIGIILDFHHPAFNDYKFKECADNFMKAQQGAKVTIPTNPAGWSMQLTKH